MRYGQQLQQESVPPWSLHNLDYDSIKQMIKVKTTQNQATAIAISSPGDDTALHEFENDLYFELYQQHQRIHLFVTSKADEISSRFNTLSRRIDRWIGKCSQEPTTSQVFERHCKVAEYERELSLIRDEIQALLRFVSAQVIGIRKIIKSYRKWTGSTALVIRFNLDMLSDPNSFTCRDFSPFQRRYSEILQILRDTHLRLGEPSTPASTPSSNEHRPGTTTILTNFEASPPPSTHVAPPQDQPTSQIKYWNEYDNNSEAGRSEDYVIYSDPEQKWLFSGLGCSQVILCLLSEKFQRWFHLNRAPERQPFLRQQPTPTYD